MSLFKKASPWVVASLMATASAFAQSNNCCPQPPKPKCCEESKPLQLSAAYNAPARVDVRGCWDVYASGSFTYWQPSMSNIELGYVSTSETENGTTTNFATFVNQDFGYKPGFKVELGMNFDHDNWDSTVGYTWFRGSETTSKSSSTDNISTLSSNPVGNTNNISQNWKLHMDLLDWDLGRSYYVGTKLTFRTAFGARAAWIRQSIERSISNVAGHSADSSDRSHSWAVGPRTTIKTNWALGEGFRLFGNGGADILYTRYPKLEGRGVSSANPNNVYIATQDDVNSLTTHMDLEFGLGWGSYFDCNNWHVDLTVGYGFQAFFDQNMFRTQIPGPSYVPNVPNGNLYVHGLTATFRFDF